MMGFEVCRFTWHFVIRCYRVGGLLGILGGCTLIYEDVGVHYVRDIGIFPSRRYCPILVWKIYTGPEMDRLGIGIVIWSGHQGINSDGSCDCRFTLAILHDGNWDCRFWPFFIMGFGIAVLPWQLFCYRVWGVPFYLAFCDTLLGTGRMAHRVEGLLVILGGFTLIYQV